MSARQLVKLSDVIIPTNRQRQLFEPQALMELSEGIEARGLMHAPVMRETPEGLVLVAGERRLRAIENLQMLGGTYAYNGQPVPTDYVPYVTLGQLNELEAQEAELEENLFRKDLTWQENSQAMAALHSLRSKQAQLEGRIHTIADTAKEVKGRSDGGFQDAVRKDVIVAQHLANPEVMKAKSAEEAFKILKKQEQVKKDIALAHEVGKTFTADVHRIFNQNCLSWMSNADPEQFDVILTDPPYGMGAQDFGDGGGGRLSNHTHKYDDSYESWVALMQEWCPLAYRVAKPQAHAYVFCDIANFPVLSNLMKAAGWYVFRTPFICVKPNSGRVPLPDEGPRRQYEVLLYAIKGHKKTTAIYSDVITTMGDPGLLHGAQKPVALFENLLQRSVRAGDKVLDSFAGSGTIIPACHNLKCEATALEQEPQYYGICLKRAQELKAAGTPEQAAALGGSLGAEIAAMMGK